MTVAASLLSAAYLTPPNLFALWEADTLKTKVQNFWAAISPQFDDQTPNDRPIGAWIAVIAAFAPSIQSYDGVTQRGDGTIGTFQTAVDYIYRLCKFAHYYRQQSLISATQATAILNAYNAQFA